MLLKDLRAWDGGQGPSDVGAGTLYNDVTCMKDRTH